MVPRSHDTRRSAYILKLGDVVRHLFGVPMFARFAGTRTKAWLHSPFYQHLDLVHGHAISTLACGEDAVASGIASDEGHTIEGRASEAAPPISQLNAPSDAAPGSLASGPSCTPGPSHPSHIPETGEDEVDADPGDEVMTGAGDCLTLMFAVFVDGVQLHQHGRATTAVIGLKCLDLPGFLANTDLACYALAFIGGSKEPSNLYQIMGIILKQFKDHEPTGQKDDKGESPLHDFSC